MSLIARSPGTGIDNDSVTRATLLSRLLNEYDIGNTGSATAGGQTDQLFDTTNLLSRQYSRRRFRGGWLRLVTAAGQTANARVGEIRPIIDYDPDLGKITVSPPFDAAIVKGDTYEIWRKFDPSRALTLLNTIASRNLKQGKWQWLSEIYNFDTPAVPDQVGGFANVETNLGNAGVAGLMEFGQEGAILWSDGNVDGNSYVCLAGGLGSGSRLQPGRSYHFSTELMWSNCEAGTTVALEVWDESHVTRYAASAPFTAPYMGRAWLEFIAPTTTSHMIVVLRGTSVAKQLTVALQYPVFYELGGKRLPAPAGLESHQDIRGVFEVRAEDVGGGFMRHGFNGEPKEDFDLQPMNHGYWYVNRKGIERPTYVYAMLRQSSFADDTTVYQYDQESLLHSLAEAIYRVLNMQFEGRYAQPVADAHAAVVRHNIEQHERIQDIVRTPALFERSAGFNDSYLGDL